MIFRPELAAAVMAGEKTVTRRACSDNPRSPWYRRRCGVAPGQTVAIQPGRGRANIGTAIVTDVRRERLGHLTDAEARREGFPDAKAFEETFAALNAGYDDALVVWVVALSANRFHHPDADPAKPRFTFGTTSSSPHSYVRCHHCGWDVRGGKGTFERADVHVCSAGPRAGLARDESPEEADDAR